MEYQSEAVDRPAQPVLSIRTRVPVKNLPEALGQAYMAIGQYLESLGKAPAGDPFVAYYNMDMEDLDTEIGFPVSGIDQGKGEIKYREIPAGKFATCLHVGPYNELGAAYEALTGWVNEEGYEVSGTVYEFYLNDPVSSLPEDLKTLILFPIIP
jgi:effector-binding domain-containing protein